MAYSHTNSKGNTYFLHHKVLALKNGNAQTLYFFKKEIDDENAVETVPDTYVVSETKNGVLVLKRSKNEEEEYLDN